MVKLIGLNSNDVVYKYIKFPILEEMLRNEENHFVKVSSWADNEGGDSFEGLFQRLNLYCDDQHYQIKVSQCCDQLYGQSWTFIPDTWPMWASYSHPDNIDNVAVLVRTTVNHLVTMMIDSFDYSGHNIDFVTNQIGRVEYKNQKEIDEWLLSLGRFPIEKVQEYNLRYSLLKRKSYSFEHEIRCLAWGEDMDKEQKSFHIEKSMFDQFICDPRLGSSAFDRIRKRLLELKIDGNLVIKSSL